MLQYNFGIVISVEVRRLLRCPNQIFEWSFPSPSYVFSPLLLLDSETLVHGIKNGGSEPDIISFRCRWFGFCCMGAGCRSSTSVHVPMGRACLVSVWRDDSNDFVPKAALLQCIASIRRSFSSMQGIPTWILRRDSENQVIACMEIFLPCFKYARISWWIDGWSRFMNKPFNWASPCTCTQRINFVHSASEYIVKMFFGPWVNEWILETVFLITSFAANIPSKWMTNFSQTNSSPFEFFNFNDLTGLNCKLKKRWKLTQFPREVTYRSHSLAPCSSISIISCVERLR